jgi:hypothetical protein
MRWALALGVLAAVGCSNDIDSLFAKTQHGADAGAKPTVKPEPLPTLPALPDMNHVAGCEQCAKDTCDKARTNCLEDDDCTAELRCKGKCSDVACLQKCLGPSGSSPWYGDYSKCVFGQCPTECNTGNNFECQGNYDWPAAVTANFDVTFQFDNNTNLARDTIRVCGDGVDCTGDQAVVGLDNSVTLNFNASTAVRPFDFRGRLEVDAGSKGARLILYLPPLSRTQKYAYPALTTTPAQADGARPTVTVGVGDCLGAVVAGATISLPDFPDVKALAFNASFGFAEGPTTAAGLAALVNLPDSAATDKVRVRAERPDGQVITEQSVWVRPGFLTWIALAPAARSN